MRHSDFSHSILKHRNFLSLTLGVSGLLLGLANLAVAADANQAGNPAPSAFVYAGAVDTTHLGFSGFISGFAVASDGSAQPVPGSPLAGASESLVANPQYVVGTDSQNIVTYLRGSDGSLQKIDSVDGIAYNLYSGSYVAGITLDDSGQNLYAFEGLYDGANSAILTWTLDTDGQVAYDGSAGLPLGATVMGWPLNFAADNRHAYSTTVCKWDGEVQGVARNANGAIQYFDAKAVPPPPLGPGQEVGCTDYIAVSSAGYATVLWDGSYCCGYNGVAQAMYTINGDGTLSLVPNSTFIPAVTIDECWSCASMAFDPSGRYLAIAGSISGPYAAIQIYELQADGRLQAMGPPQHWGASSTAFTSVAWDSANHVYATNSFCDRRRNQCSLTLDIFNFANGVLTPAPGSPHVLGEGSPASLLVVP